jgi:hypothetical protein
MTTIVRTRSTDGVERDWSSRAMSEPEAISAALEFAGPGATVVRIWREGDW